MKKREKAKKIERKRKNIYMTKKREEERRILLFHTFAVYRQGPWPMHTNGAALLLARARLHAIKPPLLQPQGFYSHML
jgi:hypothetical protein